MPTDGSAAPTRLTFASVTDIPYGFTPDGEAVLFTSNRAMGIRWMPQLWTVPLTGGTPAMLQDAFAEQAVYSPDGETLVMVRGATKWTRRGYRGSANRELWLTTGDDDYRRLTDFDGDDDNPSWLDSETISFLSSRNGRKNVFKLDIAAARSPHSPTTRARRSGFPRPSADGAIIAYEFEDGIWTVLTRRRQTRPGSPSRSRPISSSTRSSVAPRATAPSDLTVSPDGKLAAFVVHGDIFVTDIVSKDDQEIAKPPTVQPHRHARAGAAAPVVARWRSASSSPPPATATSISLPSPAPTRISAWTDSFDFTTTPGCHGPANEQDAQFSPDGEQIAFVRGKGDLVVADADGGNEIVLHDHFYPPTYSWSPDGRWIAYASEDQHANSEIFIVPSTGGEPYNVSRHPDFDENPVWSPDGNRLVWSFASRRQRLRCLGGVAHRSRPPAHPGGVAQGLERQGRDRRGQTTTTMSPRTTRTTRPTSPRW